MTAGNHAKCRRRDYQGYFYILPWLLGFTILQLYPFVQSFYYSLTEYNVMSKPKWVGIQNYITLFTKDPEFWNSFKVTWVYTLYTVPGKIIMALIVALLMNRTMRGINLLRTVYYIPSLFGGSVAICILWRLMF